MDVYLASDFHLKFIENRDDIDRRLRACRFLDHLKGRADMLIFGGDVFDLWFAWGSVIIKNYFPVLKKLADLRDEGCRIVFLAGNHDFCLDHFFTETLGIEVCPDTFSETIDGKRILVTHGDLYTKNDLRYKVFRAIVRSQPIMKAFLALHPNIGLRIGAAMSRSSRNRQVPPHVQKAKEKGLEEAAQSFMRSGHDLVFMGHAHNPRRIEFPEGTYINLGDWVVHNSYARIRDGEVELLEFSPISLEVEPGLAHL